LEDEMLIPDNAELRNKMKAPIEGSCFCCATVFDPEDVTRLLVIDYLPDWKKNPDWVQIKFAGGTNDTDGGRNDETPAHTLFAEIKEEVLGEDGVIVEWVPFWDKYMPPRSSDDGDSHTKYASVIEISGDLRKDDFIEGKEEEGSLHEEKLKPPRFESVTVLAGRSPGDGMFKGHKPILKELCRLMQGEHRDYVYAFEELCKQGF